MSETAEMVAAGWDQIGPRYLEWSLACDWEPRRRYLAHLLRELPEGSEVLELGCGAGLPVTSALAERFRVTAIDVSPGQVELARANAPRADIQVADRVGVEFPQASFDGVAAFYCISHVSREQHADLYSRILRWLRPGGVLVAALTWRDTTAWVEEDWLGAPMFFSGFDADTNRKLLRQAGFELERDEILGQLEFGAEARFLWVLARRP